MNCESCAWNDDGLCDRLGLFVDDDDSCKFYRPDGKEIQVVLRTVDDED